MAATVDDAPLGAGRRRTDTDTDVDGGAGGRTFLALPPPLTGRNRRIHLAVLALLIAYGAAQGTFWSLTTVAWSPIDEVAHVAYVESIARGRGIPTIGVDLVSDDLLRAAKEIPTNSYRADPVAPVNTDPRWSSTRVPYEAVHGPVYYAAMVPFFWAGQPLGTDGSLYAIRLGSVALTLAALPLTWLLARRLFPSQPVVWLLAAGLLAAVNSLNPGSVSNDSAAMVLGTVAVLAFLRALNRPDRPSGVLLAGAAFSLTLLTKMTAVVLVPFLVVAFAAAVVITRPRVVEASRWIGLFVAGSALTVAPWLAWNLVTYGSASASDAIVEAVGSPLLGTPELDLATVQAHLLVARRGIWLGPLLESVAYQGLWERAAIVALVLGLLACALRRRWRDLAVLAWCGSAVPLAFVAMEAIFLGPFQGNGGPVGRHLWVVLPPTMVMIAAATTLVVGARWAPAVTAWLAASSLWLQIPLTEHFVSSTYLTASLGDDLGPVVYQDVADGLAPGGGAVVIDAGCPVGAVGLGVHGAVPPSLAVTTGATSETATLGGVVGWIPTYRLDRPTEGPLTIAIPPDTIVRSSGDERTDRAAFTTGEGDPVVTAYCVVDDAEQRSFARLYAAGHPDQVSLEALRVTPVAFAAAGSIAAAGLTLAAMVGTVRRRRDDRGSGSSPTTEPTASPTLP